MIEKEPTHTNKVQKIMFLFFMDAEREREKKSLLQK